MALQRTGSGTYRQALSSEGDKAAQARAILARQIASGLSRFEILSDAPAPQNLAMFVVPVARMLGEAMPSGVPPMDDC